MSSARAIPNQEPLAPVCCGRAAALVLRAGIVEVRAEGPWMEGAVLSQINEEMRLSGERAKRFLESLRRDGAPAAVVYRCAACGRNHFRMDQI